MDAIVRTAAIYFVVLILFRISGRRSLSEMAPFDFVLLLIIGESTQQALLGQDFSITHAVLVITTLLFIDVALSLLKLRVPAIGTLVDGVPTIIVADGRPLERELRKARLTVSDVLETARRTQGIDDLGRIKFAVLETNGGISIVPAD